MTRDNTGLALTLLSILLEKGLELSKLINERKAEGKTVDVADIRRLQIAHEVARAEAVAELGENAAPVDAPQD